MKNKLLFLIYISFFLGYAIYTNTLSMEKGKKLIKKVNLKTKVSIVSKKHTGNGTFANKKYHLEVRSIKTLLQDDYL